MRISLAIVLSVLALPAIALAQPRPHEAGLENYMTRIDPKIRSYRSVLQTLARILMGETGANVDPDVERLERLADRVWAIGSRWDRVCAPNGLRARHRGMGNVFRLEEEAVRMVAAALFTRHPEELVQAAHRSKALFRSAAYLQKRWAAAVRGALVRGEMRVPIWVEQMAKP